MLKYIWICYNEFLHFKRMAGGCNEVKNSEITCNPSILIFPSWVAPGLIFCSMGNILTPLFLNILLFLIPRILNYQEYLGFIEKDLLLLSCSVPFYLILTLSIIKVFKKKFLKQKQYPKNVGYLIFPPSPTCDTLAVLILMSHVFQTVLVHNTVQNNKMSHIG